jgi:hypothetical protein
LPGKQFLPRFSSPWGISRQNTDRTLTLNAKTGSVWAEHLYGSALTTDRTSCPALMWKRNYDYISDVTGPRL